MPLEINELKLRYVRQAGYFGIAKAVKSKISAKIASPEMSLEMELKYRNRNFFLGVCSGKAEAFVFIICFVARQPCGKQRRIRSGTKTERVFRFEGFFSNSISAAGGKILISFFMN